MIEIEKLYTEYFTPIYRFLLSLGASKSLAEELTAQTMFIAINKIDSFKKLSLDYQNVLLQINIADDYFKSKKQIDLLEEEIKAKEKELYDLKHELISYQIKIENMEKNVKNLNADLNENAKKIIRLETELKESKKNS